MRCSFLVAFSLLACISCTDETSTGAGAGATVLATDLSGARGIAVTDEYVFVSTTEGLVRVTKDGSERKTVFDGKTSYHFAVRDDTLYFNVEGDSPYYIQGAGEPIAYGGDRSFNNLTDFDVDEDRQFAFFSRIGAVEAVPLGTETLDSIQANDTSFSVYDVATAHGLVVYGGYGGGDDHRLYTFDLATQQTTEEFIDVEDVGRNDTDFYALDAGRLYRRGMEDVAFREVARIGSDAKLAVNALGAFVETEDASGTRGISLVAAKDDTSRDVFRYTKEIVAWVDGIAADERYLFMISYPAGVPTSAYKLVRVELPQP
jgi:hypothetical protein